MKPQLYVKSHYVVWYRIGIQFLLLTFSSELLIILAVNISLSLLSRLLIPEILTGFPKHFHSATQCWENVGVLCFCRLLITMSCGLSSRRSQLLVVVMMASTRQRQPSERAAMTGPGQSAHKHRGSLCAQTQRRRSDI